MTLGTRPKVAPASMKKSPSERIARSRAPSLCRTGIVAIVAGGAAVELPGWSGRTLLRFTDRHRLFALGGEGPPRQTRPAVHEAHRCDEGVEHTWVVAYAGDATELVVKLIGVTAGELGGPIDAYDAQIFCDGGCDV